MRHRITLIAAALTLLLQGLPARAQFAVIDAQNSANQIMSYIQDGENALRSIESIAQVFESIERVHGALDSLQSIYSRVSPVIRDTKAVADIAVNYARVVDDWERYSDYMKSLDGASTTRSSTPSTGGRGSSRTPPRTSSTHASSSPRGG